MTAFLYRIFGMGLQDDIAVHLQHLAGHVSHLIVVLNQQDGLPSDGGPPRGWLGPSFLYGGVGLGQQDLERGASSRHALDQNMAATLPYNAMNRCQPKPRSLPSCLG